MNKAASPRGFTRIAITGTIFSGLAMLAACTTVRPQSASMDSSMAAIRAADELGAARVPQANLYLVLAKEQAEKGAALLRSNDTERAGMVFMRAEADAELALALARENTAHAEAQMAAEKLHAK